MPFFKCIFKDLLTNLNVRFWFFSKRDSWKPPTYQTNFVWKKTVILCDDPLTIKLRLESFVKPAIDLVMNAFPCSSSENTDNVTAPGLVGIQQWLPSSIIWLVFLLLLSVRTIFIVWSVPLGHVIVMLLTHLSTIIQTFQNFRKLAWCQNQEGYIWSC
jgi:hypothetical protein